MFAKLKKLFRRTLFTTIAALVIFVGITNIIFTSNVLLRDFTAKASQISMQYADGLELKINNIIETTVIFENMNNLGVMIADKRNSYEVIRVLNEIKNPNLNITGATVVNLAGDVFFSDSNCGKDFLKAAIAGDYLAYLKRNVTGPRYILRDDFNKENGYAYTTQDLLVYAKPLYSGGAVTGYLIVGCSIDNFVKSLDTASVLFLEHANLYLYSSDTCIMASPIENGLLVNRIACRGDLNRGSYTTMVNRHFTMYNAILDGTLGLAVDIPVFYILAQNVGFVILIAGTICIILLLFLLLFRYFIAGIITPLSQLSGKMNDYIKKKAMHQAAER